MNYNIEVIDRPSSITILLKPNRPLFIVKDISSYVETIDKLAIIEYNRLKNKLIFNTKDYSLKVFSYSFRYIQPAGVGKQEFISALINIYKKYLIKEHKKKASIEYDLMISKKHNLPITNNKSKKVYGNLQ